MGRFLCAVILARSLAAQAPDSKPDLNRQIAELTALVQKLQSRVDLLEAKLAPPTTAPAPAVQPEPTVSGPVAAPVPETASSAVANLLGGTSLNFLFDGYYGYNLNDPIGRINLLRAFDVSSNAFSLNQADVVVENAADPANGKRWGMRLDLQFGQATETLQGNPVNEPQPQIYRNIFQAYGTYVVPVGSGLTVDFGKFASSLGIENNYTQDQVNYSRSFWFDFLPFYHMGVRMNYQVNSVLGVNYWAVNGTEQTEPFNNFKDQFIGLSLQPRKNLSWNVNYYLGQEHPDVMYLATAIPGLPIQQGVGVEPIPNAPTGKLHIFDSYVNWQVSPKLTLALEGDYVIERLQTTSAPMHVDGGAAYARYQLSPRFAIGGRTEYLSDRGGLYTGISMALKEATLTLEEKLAANLVLRQEWRTDFSNQAYFLTDVLGSLKRQQSTATMGVVWWFGSKKSPW
jgi:Putative beta-barrel porin-2, OmpL-like. bbp2